MIERLTVIGTGLIGGSLGLAWAQRQPEITIVGHDRPEVLERAEERGAIDEKAADPLSAVADTDLVVLATPLATTVRLLDTIADALPEGCFVTDVASVKEPVLDQAADVLPDHATFLGGHPMAGAEHSGIDHADPLLFENAVYSLCLPEDTDEAALDEGLAPLVELIEATGSRPLVLDAPRHDRLVAATSHVPQLLSVALVNLVATTEDDADRDLALQLAGGGFRDMTRIASSPFDVWRDVLVGNERAIHDALSRLRRGLRTLRNRLIEEDLDALEDAFDEARTARDTMPQDSKGFLHPLSDVYVRAPDEEGVIHELSGHLLDADLNIKDIELQTIRDGTGGTFRLAFETAGDAEEAVAVLSAAGYEARRP
ncbi:prephenate dehydrogenase [Salinibacter ruber]|uniref:prephenate dehydrogenase n=1 Tax=Salinibacter ruber TaxID=146919 RepID=UPI002169409F|nr:prephenate dehydrogenase [Salinibacter ruber]MCS4183092.1 prephenate dehydrogenase [Salinibacter ruber]